MSPGAYVERVRLEAARRTVECADTPLARVAAETGFGTGGEPATGLRLRARRLPCRLRHRFGLRTAQALPA